MKKLRLFGVLCTTLFMLVAGSASAAVVTVPVGLNPGDMYRLVFVTSSTRNATSTNIADYNAFVTGVANTQVELLGLGTTWSAIGSTSTVDARDNTGTNPSTDGAGVPIYLLDGSLFVQNNADLWNATVARNNSLSVQQDGVSISGAAFVWTGTWHDGTAATPNSFGGGNCSSVSFDCVEVGFTSAIDCNWVGCNVIDQRNSSYRLYGMSDILTVAPVPVPAGVWLFGSGLIGLIGIARRKKV
jgi:hypothetical protein